MLLRSVAQLLLTATRGRNADLKTARERLLAGDGRGAIPLLRRHLNGKPHDVQAINDLASCLHDVGQVAEAARLFDLAYAIDDGDLPTLVNRAKRLFESGHVDKALPLLRRAKLQQPYFAHADSVYSGARFILGDVVAARRYALNAWLGSFDSLRFANCHLFYTAYADVPEEEVAAEHAFWAATLAPAPAPASTPAVDSMLASVPKRDPEKTRIAYWSLDIRNHSVRYFFRPLLENHDRSRFEVLILSDFPTQDHQTDLMRAACDHFVDVNALQDSALLHFLQALELDVLVELAGQSSYNRLNLLQSRVAKVQLSGIGYPPTTGLSTLDGKFADPVTVGPDPDRHYAEKPFTLPMSFWCFAPCEELPAIEPPPCLASEVVTFGCVGNISKITDSMLAAWAHILAKVPMSRLLVRRLNFNDPGVVERFSARVEAHGVSRSRLVIRGPIPGVELFGSYREIDIVLDTFPFNGGTTTCFAAYMGVPVVTLAGRSLLSRMGASIMHNMGADALVAETIDDYVTIAVRTACDPMFLEAFRAGARARFESGHLGDGAGFARAVEHACLQRLLSPELPASSRRTLIPPLPERELVRRAGTCLRWGQRDAARRIISHCLDYYPKSAGAHILAVQPLADEHRFSEAADTLMKKLGQFPEGDRLAVMFNAIRYLLLAERPSDAALAVNDAAMLPQEGLLDALQLRLYQARLGQLSDTGVPIGTSDAAVEDVSYLIVVPCDDDRQFAELRAAYRSLPLPTAGSRIEIRQCPEGRKAGAYWGSLRASDAGIVVWAQKNVVPCQRGLLALLRASLRDVDAVGLAGSRRWDRVDWRSGPATDVAGSFLAPSGEAPGSVEVHVLGDSRSQLVAGQCVLDGSLIALSKAAFAEIADELFHAPLEGADTLIEEYASHIAASKGWRLAAHLALGVFIDTSTALCSTYLAEGRWEIGQLLNLDPFATHATGTGSLTVPAATREDAVLIQQRAFGRT